MLSTLLLVQPHVRMSGEPPAAPARGNALLRPHRPQGLKNNNIYKYAYQKEIDGQAGKARPEVDLQPRALISMGPLGRVLPPVVMLGAAMGQGTILLSLLVGKQCALSSVLLGFPMPR